MPQLETEVDGSFNLDEDISEIPREALPDSFHLPTFEGYASRDLMEESIIKSSNTSITSKTKVNNLKTLYFLLHSYNLQACF